MAEEIIIDGVNVAGCEYATKSIPIDCENNTCFCYEDKNCYYKQLKRLQQENKELKAENAKLKEEITELEEKFLTLNGKSYSYYTTLQEIKAIAEALKLFIDFSVTKTATEVEYDYAVICNELELRLYKVLKLITKAEEE